MSTLTKYFGDTTETFKYYCPELFQQWRQINREAEKFLFTDKKQYDEYDEKAEQLFSTMYQLCLNKLLVKKTTLKEILKDEKELLKEFQQKGFNSQYSDCLARFNKLKRVIKKQQKKGNLPPLDYPITSLAFL
ncbi:MAG: hypothetical protein AB4372_30865 [Xenococcus sp. (in: cyanobacteria)]